MGPAWSLGFLGISKMLHGKRPGFRLVRDKDILGHGNANAICAPESDLLIDIRLESGDIVERIEGDDDVVTEVEGVPDGAFHWSRREARAPLLCPCPRRFTLTADLFMSRGARMCHRSPTKCGVGWSLWPRSERAGGQQRKRAALWVRD